MKPRHLYRLTLSTACVCGLGVAGCSRPSLDLGRDDPSAQTAVEERAAEAVQRSRQELLAQDLRAARAQGTNIVRTPRPTPQVASQAAPPEIAPRSRFRMPIPKLLSSRRHERETGGEDPFLAHADRDKKHTPAAKSDPVQDFLREQRPAGVDSRASVVNFETAVEAELSDSNATRPDADHPRTKTPTDTSSRSAIARKREAAENQESRTPARTATAERQKSRSADLAHQHRGTIGERSPLASGAPPFPKTTELDVASANPRTGRAAPFPTSSSEPSTSSASTRARHKMRAAGNPLAVDAPLLTDDDEQWPTAAAPSPANAMAQAPGVAIAAMLDEARAATEQGEFTKALELVADAQRLATESDYVFARNEQQPVDAIARIAREIEDAERLSRGELAAEGTRKARFSTASFTAGQHPAFSDQLNETTPERGDLAGALPSQPGADAALAKPPVWPEPTRVALEDSNQLWQPSAGIASIPQSRSTSAEAQQFAREIESQLAATQPPSRSRVAATEANSQSPWQSASVQPVTVELGRPTAFVPETVAFEAPPSRLVAPPPLAIGELSQEISIEQVATESSGTRGKSRAIWYVVFGSLAGVVLLLYRRKAYGAQRSVDQPSP